MPRRKSLVTVIREMVQEEVGNAIGSLLGAVKHPRIAGDKQTIVRRSSCRIPLA